MDQTLVSSLPYYVQVRETLRAEIRAGRFVAGDQLPTEEALTRRFKVSRSTVRQAIQGLVQDGLLRRQAGKGSFVTAPVMGFDMSVVGGIFVALEQNGVTITTEVLDCARVPADETTRQRLQLPGDAQVLAIERVRRMAGQDRAVIYSQVLLPLPYGAALTEEDVGASYLYPRVELAAGIQIAEAEAFVQAQAADHHVAEALQLSPRAPVLYIERVSLARGGAPLIYERIFVRSDVLVFHHRLRYRKVDPLLAGLQDAARPSVDPRPLLGKE